MDSSKRGAKLYFLIVAATTIRNNIYVTDMSATNLIALSKYRVAAIRCSHCLLLPRL